MCFQVNSSRSILESASCLLSTWPARAWEHSLFVASYVYLPYVYLLRERAETTTSKVLPTSVLTHNLIITYFSGGTGVWTQGFKLAGKVLYHRSHSSSPFFLWLLWKWSLDFCLGWLGPKSSHFRLFAVAGMTGAHHHAQLFFLLGWGLKSGLAWSCDLFFLRIFFIRVYLLYGGIHSDNFD
jgi:hypothetical protein